MFIQPYRNTQYQPNKIKWRRCLMHSTDSLIATRLGLCSSLHTCQFRCKVGRLVSGTWSQSRCHAGAVPPVRQCTSGPVPGGMELWMAETKSIENYRRHMKLLSHHEIRELLWRHHWHLRFWCHQWPQSRFYNNSCFSMLCLNQLNYTKYHFANVPQISTIDSGHITVNCNTKLHVYTTTLASGRL